MNKTYDYRENIKSKIINYIKTNIDLNNFEDDDDLAEEVFLNIDISYVGLEGNYKTREKLAKKYVSENMDLLHEAISQERAYTRPYYKASYDKLINCIFEIEGWEYLDGIIRDYVFNECVYTAIEEVRNNSKIS